MIRRHGAPMPMQWQALGTILRPQISITAEIPRAPSLIHGLKPLFKGRKQRGLVEASVSGAGAHILGRDQGAPLSRQFKINGYGAPGSRSIERLRTTSRSAGSRLGTARNLLRPN